LVLLGLTQAGFGGARIRVKEGSAKDNTQDASVFRQGLHLFITQVAWMVVQCIAPGMAYKDGSATDFHSLVKTPLPRVGEIHQHAQAVHGLHNLTAEGGEPRRNSRPGTIPTRTNPVQVIVPDKSHHSHSMLKEPREIFETAFNGMTSFDAEQGANAPRRSSGLQVLGIADPLNLIRMARQELVTLGQETRGTFARSDLARLNV
jgi:hypothetical protein